MDIVNRLKTYMEAHGIGSTQFADACRIPRPTLSQILSGRNKKISDEVISKIHQAYPGLSVLWLLFGEGHMEASANIGFSEPQRGVQTAPKAAPVNGFGPAAAPARQEPIEDDGGLFGPANVREPFIFDDDEPEEVNSDDQDIQAGEPMVTVPADGSKSIVSIMVFYSDNSYQSFVPR